MEQLVYHLQLFLEKLYWIIKVNMAAGCNKAGDMVYVCLFNCISFITFNLCRYLLRNNWVDAIWLCLSCEHSRCRRSLLRHRASARQTVYLYVTPHTQVCFGNICSVNLIVNTSISVVFVCKGPATQDEIGSDSHPILSKLALFYNLYCRILSQVGIALLSNPCSAEPYSCQHGQRFILELQVPWRDLLHLKVVYSLFLPSLGLPLFFSLLVHEWAGMRKWKENQTSLERETGSCPLVRCVVGQEGRAPFLSLMAMNE